MTLFKLEIYTPYRLFFADEVETLIVQLADGEIGIYAGHSLFTSPVKTCALRIKRGTGVWESAFITNGIIEVKGSKTVLLADAAERPDEIDFERAKAAKEEAQSILKNTSFRFEHVTAKEKLIRAETRLKVYETAKTATPQNTAG